VVTWPSSATAATALRHRIRGRRSRSCRHMVSRRPGHKAARPARLRRPWRTVVV
jgi:hypothetical protein